MSRDRGKNWRYSSLHWLFATAVAGGVLMGLDAFGLVRMVKPLSANSAEALGSSGEPVTTSSKPADIALAKYLQKIGVKFYGAYWCPHCHSQKELFGKEALQYINYIECDPKGQNPQKDLCIAAKIQGFPTWEIKGQLYPGTRSLASLAELSGYPGDRNF
jgi:thiol-disulfide isomerase/thioredoxin